MLYNLVRDAAQTLLFRYQAPEAYRYSPLTITAILIALGLQLAAAWAPVFGDAPGAIAFFLVSMVLKWWVLSQVMRSMLHYFGAPLMPLSGFILATEALALPSIIVFYAGGLGILATFWSVWIFWAQAAGLMKMSQVNGLRVLLGYLAYGTVLTLLSSVVLFIFISMGWIDQEDVQKFAEQFKLLLAPQQ